MYGRRGGGGLERERQNSGYTNGRTKVQEHSRRQFYIIVVNTVDESKLLCSFNNLGHCQ